MQIVHGQIVQMDSLFVKNGLDNLVGVLFKILNFQGQLIKQRHRLLKYFCIFFL